MLNAGVHEYIFTTAATVFVFVSTYKCSQKTMFSDSNLLQLALKGLSTCTTRQFLQKAWYSYCQPPSESNLEGSVDEGAKVPLYSIAFGKTLKVVNICCNFV